MPPALSCLVFIVSALLLGASPAEAATRSHHLNIAWGQVNPGGTPARAMTINGQIPGPVLHFTQGDLAEIRVTNHMDQDTSIHWHGILVPPGMDGVPNISFPPIAPGQTFTYRFPIRQSGTYWYHSHSGLQEQRGVYGALVIHPPGPRPRQPREAVVMLSDWTAEDPHQVLRTLKRGSDWYALQKGSGQSILGAAQAGRLGDYFLRELGRMPPMDIADVAYDHFLINGRPSGSLEAQPGETLLLRVINGSATTFFHLKFAAGPLTIVAADGIPVEPVPVERLLMGVAETYDLVITMPPQGRPELRATAHDASSWASLWLGSGPPLPASRVPAPDLYHGMGGPSLAQVLTWDPATAMGMGDPMVKAGKFDQPGGMALAGMDHGEGQGADQPGSPAGTGHPAMKMPAPPGTGHGGGQHRPAGPAPSHSGHDPAPAPAAHEPDHAGHRPASAPAAHPPSHSGQGQGAAPPGPAHAAMNQAHPPPPWGKRFASDFAPLATDIVSRGPLARDGGPQRPWPPYAKLRSRQPTAPAPGHAVREIRLTLDGDMERYVWLLNGQALSEADDILIRQGEVVRFILINRTMMHHPMHLHGHFFRLLNGQGDHAPLKHTVDVAPMATTVIEFLANEVGDWFFHCHLLYHMKAGMARMVHYQDFTPPPEVMAIRPRLYGDSWLAGVEADLLSHMSEGRLHLSSTRHIFSARWKVGWQAVEETQWELTPTWEYSLDRFKSWFMGANAKGEGDQVDKIRALAGLRYLLPMNIESRTWLDHELGLRVSLEKHWDLTPRLSLLGELEYDSHDQWEGAAGLAYLVHGNLWLVAKWHSEFGWGAGLRLAF